MGVDMTMHIIDSDGNIKFKDIYNGRNSDWFEDLVGWGHGCNVLYDYWYPECGIPDSVPDEVYAKYDDSTRPLSEGETYMDRLYWGYYDFRYAKVSDFIKFFEKYRPDVDAGWVSSYEKFLYETKGIVPECLCHSKDEESTDQHFIVVTDEYDQSKWLYDFLTHHANIGGNDYIVYYFDR